MVNVIIPNLFYTLHSDNKLKIKLIKLSFAIYKKLLACAKKIILDYIILMIYLMKKLIFRDESNLRFV